MPHPLHVPRINNNDDFVKLVKLNAAAGDYVGSGDCVAQVETDKAVMDLEADTEGYVLQILSRPEDRIAVGSVLMWLGERADEPVPAAPPEAGSGSSENASRGPTAKARALLKEYALSADTVPQSGERLTAGDVEAFVAQQQPGTIGSKPETPNLASAPTVAGTPRLPTPEEHGMLNTVLWHRDAAAATYLEVEYDPQPWEQYAARYAEKHKLFLSPLGALLAHRLVEIAAATPKLNATIVDGRIYQYDRVNLGFTVQAGETLYLTVLHGADELDAAELVSALADTQRRAMAKKLKPQDVEGATISFSSMARWKVSRHVPILPPHTSLIVAHAAPRGSQVAVMGATYDHRLLSGFDVVRVLEELVRDPAAKSGV